MSGNKFETIKEIIKVVMTNSSLDLSVSITTESNLREEIGFDSLALAELAVRIEEEFDVDVFEDGLVTTVKEILEKI